MIRSCSTIDATPEKFDELLDRHNPFSRTLLVVCGPKTDTEHKFAWELLAQLGKDVSSTGSPTKRPDVWAVVRAWLVAWAIEDLIIVGTHRIPARLISRITNELGSMSLRVTFMVDGALANASQAAITGLPTVTLDELLDQVHARSRRPVPLMCSPWIFDGPETDTFRQFSTVAHQQSAKPAATTHWFETLDPETACRLEQLVANVDRDLRPVAIDGIEAGIAINGYRWPDHPGLVADHLALKPAHVDGLRYFREPTAGAAVALAHLGHSPDQATRLTASDVQITGGEVWVCGQVVPPGPVAQVLAAQKARYPTRGRTQFLTRHGRSVEQPDVVDMVRRAVRLTGGHLAA